MNRYYIAVGVLAALVLAALGYAFSVTGSPFAARDAKLDAIRVQHLSAIRAALQEYNAVNGVLPASLDQLPETSYGYSQKMKDPVTDAPYEYRKAGPSRYEICAEFAAEAKEDGQKSATYSPFGYGAQEKFVHKKGHDCWSGETTTNDQIPGVNLFNLGPAVQAEQASVRDSVRISDLFTVRTALELYYEKHKTYPKNITSWSALQKVMQTENTLSGWPQDPTGTYYYALNNDKTSYVLGAILEKESSRPTGPQYTGGTQGGMEFPRRCGGGEYDGTVLFCISGSN